MSSGPRAVPTYAGRQGVPGNYVAGLGRGAIGFTTRSDIGPARDAPAPDMPQFGMQPTKMLSQAAEGGDGVPGGGPPRGSGEKSETYDETQYDEEYGYGGTLFGDTPYEEDDAEADRIYEAIDERMDERRKRRREEQMLENMKKYRSERPKISDQFADLKRELAAVPEAAWEAIPDVGDYSLKLKQKKKADQYTPMTDSVLHMGVAPGSASSVQSGSATPMGGLNTPFGGWAGGRGASGTSSVLSGTASEVGGLAQARGTVLSLKLDKMSDSVTGQTVVDPKGYLTDLNAIKLNSDAEVGDIKKARILLRSVTTTNPKHGPGWIAAARLEEHAGKIVAARAIMKQGCEVCPESEDVWIEAARFQTADNAKTILANAVHHLPQSVKVWLQAAELEVDKERKKVVLRRALEFVPNSVKLWRTAIALEEAADARIMLGRAVECVPHSVDMWLALARLETYDNARKVLNQARTAIPSDPSIWITAAKLEEAHGHTEAVGKIIEKAVGVLTRDQVVIDREQWLKEAEAAERAGAPLTCAAIVRCSVWRGVEADDRKRTWLDDAASCLSRDSVEAARAVYAHALSVFPTKAGVWKAACDLERRHGAPGALTALLRQATTCCPHAEVLWLMWAKEEWVRGDVPTAREVLVDAFKANPDSEDIWLAAAKLEWENGEAERARLLLQKACARAPSAKVWLKLALLERECDGGAGELPTLDDAIAKYPDFDKFYMMAGQACERLHEATAAGGGGGGGPALFEAGSPLARARGYYQAGLRRCPHSLVLWQLAAALETRGSAVKGRSMLELARLKNPKSDVLWRAAVRLEVASGNDKVAATLMAKALQECPDSGLLWAEEVRTAPRPARRGKSMEALKRCDNDPHVITAVAALFVDERKVAKARKWFDRAVKLDEANGDTWAAFYVFELQHGTAELAAEVKRQCVAAEPRYGDQWCAVSKDPAHRRLKTDAILDLVAAHLARATATGAATGAAP